MTEKSSIDIFNENYETIKKNIKKAAELSGRTENDIILLAATKTVDANTINYAISKGINFIGENRVQELLLKKDALLPTAHRHFIGHLQTNKVKDIINEVEMIESVDSLKLAKEIGKAALKNNKVMPVLAEINIGNEETKSGFEYENAIDSIKEIASISGIKVCGLMAIPPKVDKNATNKEYFDKMYKLFIDIKDKNIDNISMDILSMGMSDDYAEAIECGANLVRIGSALFGKRIYK